MSEEVTDPTTSESTDTPEVTESQSQGKAEAESVEDLPKFAQKLIADLREEAKNNRVKGNEKAKKASEDTKAEYEAQFTNLSAEKEHAERQLMRVRAAVNAGIRSDLIDDFSSRLKGETEEEINEDAKRLAEAFGGSEKPKERKADPAQGKQPDSIPLNGDPVMNLMAEKLNIPI
ncbi:hypothetical protein [Actinopolyspora erythraea]|uniref:hypothetical protein n=1 Tax=Actinopolyspora erythraea TaxID=414996 RepID=UPI001184A456|nr:hypothetical protein [Actinopolyspora erythraea]